MRAIAAVGSVIAATGMCLTLSACGGQTTSGQPVTNPTSPAASSATVQATESSEPAAAPASTVTVVPYTPPPKHRVVTRYVQAPAQTTPQTSSSLRAIYDGASSVDPSAYYDGSAVFFDSPSQNIGCYVYDDAVNCSIAQYDFPQPGRDCDAGIGATVDQYGYPSLTDCSGYFDAANLGEVLPYGYSVSNGNFACVSESSGVSCLDTATGTGFTLSRAAYSPVSY